MPSFKRILVPVDFSTSSRAALAQAANLARAVGGAIEVLHVYEPSSYVGPDSLVLMPVNLAEKWELTRAQILRELEAFLGHDHAHVAIRVEIGTASDVIVATAHSGKFDAVVMGAHGGGGLSRIVGQVTEAVMRRAHCPVLTVHLPERALRESIPL
ncbi:MAG: universal stress protein [Anaeromyxobacteraceae bacterium]